MNEQRDAVGVTLGPDGALAIRDEHWAGFGIEGLRPGLCVNGQDMALTLAMAAADRATWEGDGVAVGTECLPLGANAWELRFELQVARDGTLSRMSLLSSETVHLGQDQARVRVMTLNRYGGDVVSLAQPAPTRTTAGAEPNQPDKVAASNNLESDDVMVLYDRAAGQALLLGFLSSERWQGRIVLTVDSQGTAQRLEAGFDGGDLQLEAGDNLGLESLVVLRGEDPWALLERYGDLVRERHGFVCPEAPPVSWCSWYPYRLGLTEDRLLAEARTAAARLKPLGLSIIEADLGWERQHLPSAFEPNEKFPHGLKWLSEQLAELGLVLGVWKATFTISAFDDLPAQHPEWLIPGDDGQPVSVWTWFWEPHGDIYILDLTHPGAQQWLRERFASLRAAGVGYYKGDFIGMASDPRAKRRHNPRVVAGGGTEAARIGARLIREALPDALALNCGGPPLPGTGAWPLLYICNDTGNTGLLSWEFARANFRATACHLWQNRRWGIIQSSCLCVGLPGALDEARLRATVAFLSGGQVDISDTLTTLPEDRWALLEATLPPLGLSARPVDLFEPVHHCTAADYEALCKGMSTRFESREHPPGSVWHLRVERDWDTWDLVACFAFDQVAGSERPELVNFTIPLAKLGLDPAESLWAYEFWSGQFLGPVPGGRTNPDGYAHPGDWQDLLVPGPSGTLSLSFTGPGVKLLVLRRLRPHPWVVGTSFHQSGGAELSDVTWAPERNELSGRLHRPAGQSGYLIVAAPGWAAISAEVDGRPAAVLPAANGAWRLAVVTGAAMTPWSVRFEKYGG